MKNILYAPPKKITRKTLDRVWIQSTLLFHPEKNEREYRGEIEYDPKEDTWLGRTLWGKKGSCGSHSKTVYQGPLQHQAQKAVEDMLRKKAASGYRGKHESNPLRWRDC